MILGWEFYLFPKLDLLLERHILGEELSREVTNPDFVDAFTETGTGSDEFFPIQCDGGGTAGKADGEVMPFARLSVVLLAHDGSLLCGGVTAIVGDKCQGIIAILAAGAAIHIHLQ